MQPIILRAAHSRAQPRASPPSDRPKVSEGEDAKESASGDVSPALRRWSCLRNFDLDLKDLQIVLTLKTHADIVVGHLDVLRDDGNERALQRGQIIGRRMPARALVRDDELQALLRDRGGFLLLAH